MLLAREVGAVGNPDGQGLGTELLAQRDAIQIVLDRLFANAWIRMREAAELVGMEILGTILEGIGINGIESQSQGVGIVLQSLRIGGSVPREMRSEERRVGKGWR